MKTSFKLLLLAAIFGTALFTGCKKYEEGPTISLASKKSRAVNSWKLASAYWNGVQQSSISTDVWDIKKDGTYTETDQSSVDTGKWEFGSDKESLIVTPTGSSTAISYKILRLKSKEMWLEYTFGTSVLEYHYEPN